jgi:hypothetical protein
MRELGRRCHERKHVIIAVRSGGIGSRVMASAWAGVLCGVHAAECQGRQSEVTSRQVAKRTRRRMLMLGRGGRPPALARTLVPPLLACALAPEVAVDDARQEIRNLNARFDRGCVEAAPGGIVDTDAGHAVRKFTHVPHDNTCNICCTISFASFHLEKLTRGV